MSARKSSSVPRKTALCYVRLSYTKDESDRQSPERQRANIQRICEREGWIPEWIGVELTDGRKSSSCLYSSVSVQRVSTG
jgi:hypothetical protein